MADTFMKVKRTDKRYVLRNITAGGANALDALTLNVGEVDCEYAVDEKEVAFDLILSIYDASEAFVKSQTGDKDGVLYIYHDAVLNMFNPLKAEASKFELTDLQTGEIVPLSWAELFAHDEMSEGTASGRLAESVGQSFEKEIRDGIVSGDIAASADFREKFGISDDELPKRKLPRREKTSTREDASQGIAGSKDVQYEKDE